MGNRAHGTVNPERGTHWDWRDDEKAPLTALPLSLQYHWLLITIHPVGALRGPLAAAGYDTRPSQMYPLCNFVYTICADTMCQSRVFIPLSLAPMDWLLSEGKLYSGQCSALPGAETSHILRQGETAGMACPLPKVC